MIRMNNIKGRHRMRAMNERQHWGWDSTSLPLIGWIPYSDGWRHIDLLIDLSKTEGGKGISDNWMTLFNRCEGREKGRRVHTKSISPPKEDESLPIFHIFFPSLSSPTFLDRIFLETVLIFFSSVSSSSLPFPDDSIVVSLSSRTDSFLAWTLYSLLLVIPWAEEEEEEEGVGEEGRGERGRLIHCTTYLHLTTTRD